MANNLALFITHHVFLTDAEISTATSGKKTSVVGHCVAVWVDAKTGKTTEPAKEIFCAYEIDGVSDGPGDVEPLEGIGFRMALPRASGWSPPEEMDFDKMALWTSEMREDFLKKRDAWWFNNPKPMDVSDLTNGYIRFDIKKQGMRLGRRKYSVQHVVELSSVRRLDGTLTS
jgi:hypothetical protein